MKKITLILMVSVFSIVAGNLFAQQPVVIDKTGTDFQYYWYSGTLGKQITMDDNGKIHVAYCKTWCTETDTGYQVMYANVTDGTKLEVPTQQPEIPIKPGVIFIGGGNKGMPIYLYYGVGSRFYTYNYDMPLQAMAKVSADGKTIVPLGVQSDKNYYHNAYYANPFAMEVDEVGGVCHCLLTNPGGTEIAYWNFDGTNFSEPYQLMWSYPADGVPGHNIDARYHRNATKGADLAVSPDGSEVTVATLHPFQQIFLHKGALGGEIWADSLLSGLKDGSMVALFSTDTTLGDKGMNIPNNDPKPYTEVQVKYDADKHLHVVYDATYMDVYVDTSNWYGKGLFDSWENTYSSIAGDTNAVFYDGSEHPKPQLRHWNDVTGTHSLLAECAYPVAGDVYKWYSYGVPDSGIGGWGNYLNDGPISNIELVPNLDPQPGEPKLVCVWEEMQGNFTPLFDAEGSLGFYTYYAYCLDLKLSVSNDGVTWSAPNNITNTPDKDEHEVSLYKDIVNNKIHMMYYEDTIPGFDRNDVYIDNLADKYITPSFNGTFTVPIRKPTTEQVNIIYRELDLSGVKLGPITHYTFDESPKDVSGNGYDGKFVGDAHVAGGYLVLDGNDDAVEIPRIGGVGATFNQLTYAMWVYPTVNLVPLQFSGGINTNGWDPGAVHFKLNYGKLNVGINGLDPDLVGKTVVEPNKWSHIALTVSTTEVALYLNGNLEASRTFTAPLNLIVGGGLIGGWNNLGSKQLEREMTGQMEEVLIYNRALSAEEIVTLASVPVGVASDKNSDNIPKTFNLSQNYPNPFNPITQINYSLAGDVKVSLKVYDLQGREVCTIFNKKQQAGFYTVTYDASTLPSGVYFYRLKAGDKVFTKKMTLLK